MLKAVLPWHHPPGQVWPEASPNRLGDPFDKLRTSPSVAGKRAFRACPEPAEGVTELEAFAYPLLTLNIIHVKQCSSSLGYFDGYF